MPNNSPLFKVLNASISRCPSEGSSADILLLGMYFTWCLSYRIHLYWISITGWQENTVSSPVHDNTAWH